MFDVLGQDRIKSLFKTSIETGKISHSYLIEGERGLGKLEMAKYIAASLLCDTKGSDACGVCSSCTRISKMLHPDVRLIDEDVVKIDNIRWAIGEVNKRPYEGRRKIVIIKNFNTTTIEGQNAILKTLEEPPSSATIILLAQNTLSILDTIKSRCQNLKMFREDILLIENTLLKEGVEPSLAKFSSRYSEGNIGMARRASTLEFQNLRREIISLSLNIFKVSRFDVLKYAEDILKYRDNIDEVLNIIVSVYRDIIMLKINENNSRIINIDEFKILVEESYKLSYNKLEKALRITKDTRERLSSDTNFQLTMEVMLLGIQEAK